MGSFVKRLLAAALAVSAAGVIGGCGGDPASTSDDIKQGNVAFKVLDVQRGVQNSGAGLKVIKDLATFEEFFGAEKPAEVDFKKHWVIHYSMGIQSNGGFSTEITKIRKKKNALEIETVDTSPGMTCAVPKVITLPQVTVRINKQPETPKALVSSQPVTRECGDACPDESDPSVHYLGDSQENPEQCAVVKFKCEAGQKAFTSTTCGCGCIDTTCAPIACALFCEAGLATGEDGCLVCECAPVCQPVVCALACPDGFATGPDGCAKCACAE